jgi:hypothetical protein
MKDYEFTKSDGGSLVTVSEKPRELFKMYILRLLLLLLLSLLLLLLLLLSIPVSFGVTHCKFHFTKAAKVTLYINQSFGSFAIFVYSVTIVQLYIGKFNSIVLFYSVVCI